jgi:uncharacterized protein YjbI with pentapeptide repeats
MKILALNLVAILFIQCLSIDSIGQGVLTFKLEGKSTVEVSDTTPVTASAFSMARLGGTGMVVPISRMAIPFRDRSVDLHDQKLRNVPKAYCDSGYHSKIDLSENRIRRLGRRFQWLEADTLLLSSNKIRKIRFYTNYKTSYVDLSDNYLKELPEGFLGGVWLRHVDISNNELTSLPKNFYFSNLRELYLSNNNLKRLPPGSKVLVALEHLDLSDNDFSTFPLTIGKMRALKTLDLSGNNLKRISSQVRRLRQLEKLDLRDNDFDSKQIERIRKLIPGGCELLI